MWVWTMLCTYHYFTCYFEKYTMNQVRLLMGDLSEYATVLIIVTGSVHWKSESFYFCAAFWVVCYAMARNAVKNADYACLNYF